MKHSSSNLEAITRVISVALACVQYKTTKRPKMHDVVPMLLGNMPISDSYESIEHGEAFGGVASSSSVTRSAWKNKNLCVDECSLLSNTCEIEMSAIS
jgi:hypothetical protein